MRYALVLAGLLTGMNAVAGDTATVVIDGNKLTAEQVDATHVKVGGLTLTKDGAKQYASFVGYAAKGIKSAQQLEMKAKIDAVKRQYGK